MKSPLTHPNLRRISTLDDVRNFISMSGGGETVIYHVGNLLLQATPAKRSVATLLMSYARRKRVYLTQVRLFPGTYMYLVTRAKNEMFRLKEQAIE